MNEIERVARMICQSMHANVDPDQKVSYGIAEIIHRFYVVPHANTQTPAWRIYEPAARAIVADWERQAEAGVRALMSEPERDW